MKKQLLLTVALVIGLCIVAKAADLSSSNNTDDEFAGKIVYVQMTTNEKFTIENVKVIARGGESFLAGRGIKRNELASQHEWWEGLPVRLNLRSVVSYFPMTPQQWKDVNNR